MNETRLERLSIAELHCGLRSGSLQAQSLLKEASERHAAAGAWYNAFACINPQAQEQALAADAAFAVGVVLGPLQGLPVGIKDIFGVQGLPLYGGTPQAWPEIWNQEGDQVSTLRRHGAVLFGKNQTVEFAAGSLGVNPHWGTPRNPWGGQAHHVPGGSSSGAGVGVLQGSTVLALASDAGGSIRVPASLTGTVGLKTSYGRWRTRPCVPLYPSQDTIGIITRTAEDALLGFLAIDDPVQDWETLLRQSQRRRVAGMRIGVAPQFFADCTPDVVFSVQSALKTLEQHGATLVDVHFDAFEETVAFNRGGSLTNPEASALIQAMFAEWIPTIAPHVWDRLQVCGAISLQEYMQKRRWITDMAERIDGLLAQWGVDVFASPTTCITAPRLEEVINVDRYREKNVLVHRNAYPANVWHLPSVTLPVGLDAGGLPIGLQLCARAGQDRDLLMLAVGMESVLGNARQRLGPIPPIPIPAAGQP